MRHQLRVRVPKRFFELMLIDCIDKVIISVDHYDITLEVMDNGTDIPENQKVLWYPKSENHSG